MLLATAVAASGCSDKGQAETPSPTAESTDTITIALVASLSGTDQGLGAEAQRGALTAVAQINALGGILGKQLVLRIEDDGSQPATTAQKIKDLAEKDKIVFGVGPSTSTGASQMLPLVKDDKVLYISPSATSSDLDCVDNSGAIEDSRARCEAYKRDTTVDSAKPPPVLFKTAGPDALLAAAISQFSSLPGPNETVRPCNSVSIVRQNDSYGQPISEIVRKRFLQLSILVKGPYDLDSNNADSFSGAARVVSEQKTQCQAVIALPSIAAQYMQAYRSYTKLNNVTPIKTIGSDGFRQQQFVVESRLKPNDPTSENVSEGSFAVAADTANPERSQFNQFAALFEARYPGVAVGRYSSTAYDAVVLLASAIVRTKSTTDVAGVRRAILELSQAGRTLRPSEVGDLLRAAERGEDVNYEGASGSLDFSNITGNVPSNFNVWELRKNDEFVTVRVFDPSALTFE